MDLKKLNIFEKKNQLYVESVCDYTIYKTARWNKKKYFTNIGSAI